MSEDKIRELLNKQYITLPIVIHEMTKYIFSSPVKEELVNNIVKFAKSKPSVVSTDLFAEFYANLEHILKGTKHCDSKYSRMQLLQQVWNQSGIASLVIDNIKNNFYYDIKQKLSELERQEQLRLQAERMREAKAKKAEATKNNTTKREAKSKNSSVANVPLKPENMAQLKQTDEVIEKQVEEPAQVQTVQPKKVSIDNEQIELLKSLYNN